MTTLREAAQQALEALENSRVFVTTREKIKHPEGTEWYDERITALRDALAQQEQEPVLVVEKEPDYMSRGHFYEGSKPFIDPTLVWKLPIGTKLYTHPPRREQEQEQEQEPVARMQDMTPLKLAEGMTQEILDVIYKYSDAMPFATALGVLEIVKCQLLQDHITDDEGET